MDASFFFNCSSIPSIFAVSFTWSVPIKIASIPVIGIKSVDFLRARNSLSERFVKL